MNFHLSLLGPKVVLKVLDKKKTLNVLLEIIKESGVILASESKKSCLEINFKAKADMVTNADKTVEDYIIQRLTTEFPCFSIFSEEVGLIKSDNSDFLWIIDPLDGTTNFVHGYPFFSTSIALMYKDELIVGAVHDVSRNETFYATKGGGAYLNGEQIKVSKITNLSESLIVTGFANGSHPENIANLRHFKNALENCQAVRRTGSAALDMCYVSCGRLDAYVQKRINAYDIAAGCIILTEAGGKISSLDGRTSSLFSGEILASNGNIHSELVDIITS